MLHMEHVKKLERKLLSQNQSNMWETLQGLYDVRALMKVERKVSSFLAPSGALPTTYTIQGSQPLKDEDNTDNQVVEMKCKRLKSYFLVL